MVAPLRIRTRCWLLVLASLGAISSGRMALAQPLGVQDSRIPGQVRPSPIPGQAPPSPIVPALPQGNLAQPPPLPNQGDLYGGLLEGPFPQLDELTTPTQANQPDFSSFASQLDFAPYMFGDSFSQGSQLIARDFEIGGPGGAIADLVIAGGARRVKIAENSKAFPQDRVFFIYNHFHNAVHVDTTGLFLGMGRRAKSIDRYTLGFEKTFLDGLTSVDVRFPVTSGYSFNTPDFSGGASEAGNLALQLKLLLSSSRTCAVMLGLGIDLPTGADPTGEVGRSTFTPGSNLGETVYQMSNDAVFLAPFVGVLHVPNSRFFHQGFLQVSVPTGGNTIRVGSAAMPPAGVLREQQLLFIDYSLGAWVYRNPSARPRGGPLFHGVAAVMEFHYTSTLDAPDAVTASTGPTNTHLTFTNLARSVDVVNATIGVQTQLANGLGIRAAGVLPLRRYDNRFFDAEAQVSVNMVY